MPFYKGLARLNSLALAFILCFEGAFVPMPLEAKTRKGEKLLQEALLAEAKGDYEKALELYEQALGTDPRDTGYKLGVDRARFQAAQKMVDRGEKLRAQGKLEEALAIFQRAFALDPSSSIAEQRMRQTFDMIKKEQHSGAPTPPEERSLTAADKVKKEAEKKIDTLMDAPVLKPIKREIVNLKMNNQPAKILFETLSKMAGINVMFDPDFLSQNSGKNFPVDFQNTTLEEALDYLSILTKAYWKPISSNAIYVTLDNPQKRRDYEDYIVKVFYLQHALEPQELNEIANAVRVVGECRKVVPYVAQMALMVRCTADQVSLVQKILNDMDKPRAEIVLDVYVLEANKTKTRSLAATIANGSTAGLAQVIGFNGAPASGTTPASTSLNLARISKLSTNNFSVNMPGLFLQALLNDRTTRVLQNPQVRTVDNKKASLRIGDRYPYATGSFNVGTTGGVGGVSPYASTQFQFAEVGVNVDITPKIHGNDEVSLRVEVEVSNIRDQVNIGGLTQPVIGQRKIGEDIRIREGEINVMGGLRSNTRSKTIVGLPWLATLPGLNWLFGSDVDDRSDSELLVVLVPHLVRAPELTDLNLRGVSTGTDQQVKLSYQMKPEPVVAPAASAPAVTPVIPPPVTSPPGGSPPAGTTPQQLRPSPLPGPNVPVPASLLNPMAGPAPALKNKLSLTAPVTPVQLSSAVQVMVNVESADDLTKAPLKVEYDTKLLKLVNVSSGGLLASDGQKEELVTDLNSGEVSVSRSAGTKGISGNGSLLKLTFLSLAKGEATVRLTQAKLSNSKNEAAAPAPLPEVTLKIQ
ncbi:cohesin domain-containing protein [Bryobacter aggregatus]|uniref:cohesin domain-containing protein n=1 Tax=Bryobacter aggregatus TaxID=360054 RepID=UPI0004E280EB|nr:cohesin domain-containing protein [Bryobacter aggregatus]